MRAKRDEIIIMRTTKAEKNRIYKKMLGMGIRSLSAYILSLIHIWAYSPPKAPSRDERN